jgi:hypothetical protein
VRTSPVAGIFVQIPRVKRLARRQHRHPPSSREDVDDVLTGSPHCDSAASSSIEGLQPFSRNKHKGSIRSCDSNSCSLGASGRPHDIGRDLDLLLGARASRNQTC